MVLSISPSINLSNLLKVSSNYHAYHVKLFKCLSLHVPVCMSIKLSVHLSIIYVFCSSIYLSYSKSSTFYILREQSNLNVYIYIQVSVCLSIYHSIYLSILLIKKAIDKWNYLSCPSIHRIIFIAAYLYIYLYMYSVHL